MLPAIILSVVALVAGHPAHVNCDADTTNPFPFAVDGWSTPGGSNMHLSTKMCSYLVNYKLTTPEYGAALNVVMHESAHLRGVRKEACAELWADMMTWNVLRDVYGIKSYGPVWQTVAANVVNYTHLKPPAYQPNGQSCAV